MQWLNELVNATNFTGRGIPDRSSSTGKKERKKERKKGQHVLVFRCGMRSALQSKEEQSCIDREQIRRSSDT